MPRRTLSPRISTTVMTMSLLMTIDSFFFLDSTSIGVYLSVSESGVGGANTGPMLQSFGGDPHASARATGGRFALPEHRGRAGRPCQHLSWRSQRRPLIY